MRITNYELRIKRKKERYGEVVDALHEAQEFILLAF
jgi:hypothetical protein